MEGGGEGTAEGRGRKAPPPPCSLPAPTTAPPLVAVVHVWFALFGLVSARNAAASFAYIQIQGRLGCREGRSNLLLIVIAPFFQNCLMLRTQ